MRALQNLFSQGVAISFSGGTLAVSNISSWKLYRTAYIYRRHLYLKALAEDVMKHRLKPLDISKAVDKCPVCRQYRQYTCTWHNSLTGIPAATMRDGCEHYKANNSVYF